MKTKPILTISRSSKGDLGDRLTTCKTCRLGIFKGEDAVWLTVPMGLSHVRCVR